MPETDMVRQTPWFERRFNFDFPVGVFPCVIERLRGSPGRLEEIIREVPAHILTARVNDAWSIQEHAGHLWDLESLGEQRLADYRSGAGVLTAADLTNRKTNEADHNAKSIADILRQFRNARSKLVAALEAFDETMAARSAVHPRLNVPMRMVDWCLFMAEHDDHHLARIVGLLKVADEKR
jgi:hypothetical protein